MTLYVVVVLYKMAPLESPTVLTLLSAMQNVEDRQQRMRLLIWDNTPGGQTIEQLPQGIHYKAASHNPGLAEAYNYALAQALNEGHRWLLTLDQDTDLPIDFLTNLARLVDRLEDRSEVAAIVPHITGDGRPLSPFHFVLGALPRVYKAGCECVPADTVFALNSAATFRVSALTELNGYDPLFPLDISDLNLFRRIGLAHKQVFVANMLTVNHDFSLLRKHARMSVERYRSQLVEECAFWDLYMGPLARLERLARLIGRVIKDFRTPQAAAYRVVSIDEIKRRLTVPRESRILHWERMAYARAATNASFYELARR